MLTSFSCVVSDANGKFYTGGANGLIYVWKKNQLQVTIKAHEGAIHSLCYATKKENNSDQSYDFILSGGSDNFINIFDLEFNKIYGFSVSSTPRSIDFYFHEGVAGCSNGSIYTFTIEDKKVDERKIKELMASHSDGEVWGLDLIDNLAITSGDDNKIIVWDIVKKKKINTVVIDKIKGEKLKNGASTMSSFADNQCSRFIGINTNFNNHVAVGTNCGEVQIRRSIHLIDRVEAILHEPTRWIEFMSYSPSGELLAVGSHDSNVYVYNTKDYILKCKLTGHSSFITSFDWSVDSNFLRTNSGANELLYFNIREGKAEKIEGALIKIIEWNSCNNKFAWETNGLYSIGVSESSINSVCLSNSKKILATGDDFSLVNLYRFPCVKGCLRISLRGHSSHVTRIRFSKDDNILLSTGGFDKAIIQRKKGSLI